MFCVLVAFFASSHDLFGRHDDGFFDRDRGKIKRYRSPQVFTKELHIIYLHIYSIVVPTAPPKKDISTPWYLCDIPTPNTPCHEIRTILSLEA